MKKVLFSVAVVSAFALASCGGGPSDMCDCVDLFDEMAEADDLEAWAKEHKSDIEACEKMAEEMSDEERGKALEECEGGEEEGSEE